MQSGICHLLMDNVSVQLIVQLMLAALLGGVIGLEREWKRKEAGLQTYSLVAVAHVSLRSLGMSFLTSLAECRVWYSTLRELSLR